MPAEPSSPSYNGVSGIPTRFSRLCWWLGKVFGGLCDCLGVGAFGPFGVFARCFCYLFSLLRIVAAIAAIPAQ